MSPSQKTILLALSGLTVWYTLSFIGISGLIDSWFVEDLIWILLALSIWMPLVVGLWSYAKGHAYTDFMIGGVTGIWAYMAFSQHWYWFFNKPSPEKIDAYYAFFDTWYLLPKPADCLVPDGYHTILHALILVTLIIVMGRLLQRLMSRRV